MNSLITQMFWVRKRNRSHRRLFNVPQRRFCDSDRKHANSENLCPLPLNVCIFINELS